MFRNYVKSRNANTNSDKVKRPSATKELSVLDESSFTEKLIKSLNDNGMKVKGIIPTNFGIQIDMFKKPESDEVEKVVNKLDDTTTIKIKGNSIFIIL